jgi:hypothetical protein
MILRFCEWLASTPGSIALHESHYVFLYVMALHVLTLTLFVGTVVMVDLRLLGMAMARVPASEVIARLVPWSAAGFVLMLVSGSLLFYAEPLRAYDNVFFRIKMVTLLVAIANAWWFQRTLYRGVAAWDEDPVPPRRVRVAGAVSLALWALIITAGRMFPYQIYWLE